MGAGPHLARMALGSARLLRGDSLYQQWVSAGVRIGLVRWAAAVALTVYVLNQGVRHLMLGAPMQALDVSDFFGMAVSTFGLVAAFRGADVVAAHVLVWGISTELVLDYAMSPFAVAQTGIFLPAFVLGVGLLLGHRVAIGVWGAQAIALVASATLRPGIVRSAESLESLVAVEIAAAASLALVLVAAALFGSLLRSERIAAEQARALVERAPDGIIVLDPEGRVREANAAALDLLAPGRAIVGEPLAPAVRQHDGEPVDLALLRTAPQRLLRLRTLDGRRDLAVTAARLDGDPDAPELMLMFRVVPGPARPVTRPGSAAETLHVMVVDDDATVREAVGRLLRREGHVSSTYADAEPALEALRSGRERPDIVITDVMMPGMNGAEFASAVRAHDVTMPLVLMSGDPHGLLDGISLPGGPWVFLAKPFPRGAMQDAIARARRASGVGMPPRP